MTTAVRAVDALVDRLADDSVRWLPPTTPPTSTLRTAIDAACPQWPAEWDRTGEAATELLFPLLYTDRPYVTTATFHHLIDAACEARRGNTTVAIAAIPTGRGGSCRDADRTVASIAQIVTAAALPVRAAGDVSTLADAGTTLVARACSASYKRRATDLPDLLVAAAADTLGTEWVYLAEPLRPGRHLGRMSACPSLSKLHDPVNPFADPPRQAKRPPAGTDAMWSAAFTLGLESGFAPADRAAMRRRVGPVIGPIWRALVRHGHIRSKGAPAANEPARLSAAGHQMGDPVVIPLLGSPIISTESRGLVRAAALAGPATVVVDDLTPRFTYRCYNPATTQLAYKQLAATYAASVVFLSELPDVDSRINAVTRVLTYDHVVAAARTRHRRRRGQLSGYDAVHLAVMAACAGAAPGAVAVRSSNLPAMRALATVLADRPVLTFSGVDQLAGNGWDELSVLAAWLSNARRR